jgi:hypothetical protein
MEFLGNRQDLLGGYHYQQGSSGVIWVRRKMAGVYCYLEIDKKETINYGKFISFADFDLSDDDTCRATVRMFLQCNLVQQFHIPYDVSLLEYSRNLKNNLRRAKKALKRMFMLNFSSLPDEF